MYINSGNMILLNKRSQVLENVYEEDELKDRELERAIRDAIISEEEAVKQYELISDACKDEKIRDKIQEIANEEKVHIGELQELLNEISEENGYLEEGKIEVKTMD